MYIEQRIWVKGKILSTNCLHIEKFRLVGIICKYTKIDFLNCLFKLSSITLSWVIIAIPSVLRSGIVILLKLFSQRSNQFTPGINNQKQITIRTTKLRCISAPRSWSHKKKSVVLTFQHIHCLHLCMLR